MNIEVRSSTLYSPRANTSRSFTFLTSRGGRLAPLSRSLNSLQKRKPEANKAPTQLMTDNVKLAHEFALESKVLAANTRNLLESSH